MKCLLTRKLAVELFARVDQDLFVYILAMPESASPQRVQRLAHGQQQS